MFREDCFNFLVRRESSFPRRFEPTVDPLELLGRCTIDPSLEPGVYFERNLGKLLLGLLRPSLSAPDRFFEVRLLS
jgi:hypothetical protein